MSQMGPSTCEDALVRIEARMCVHCRCMGRCVYSAGAALFAYVDHNSSARPDRGPFRRLYALSPAQPHSQTMYLAFLIPPGCKSRRHDPRKHVELDIGAWCNTGGRCTAGCSVQHRFPASGADGGRAARRGSEWGACDMPWRGARWRRMLH